MNNNHIDSNYIGRFAPSPSGSLHFGSLVAALGSYLRARSLQGKWLVRIEDIDPPREVAGAATDILQTLEAFGLFWDETELYQSQQLELYQSRIDQLLAQSQAYFCQCSRKQIQVAGGRYQGLCRQVNHTSGAVRIKNTAAVDHFTDKLLGYISVAAAFAQEDFIIKRSDGLFAYQLAVVLDDAHQGITEVVRGADLVEATCRQISLQQQLNLATPAYLHLPLASIKAGFKLSKQNHATPVDKKSPQMAINAALKFLGQPAVDLDSDVSLMIAQAVAQFDIKKIPQQVEILLGHVDLS